MDTQKAYQSIHQGAILKSADINELTLAIRLFWKEDNIFVKRFKTILNRMQTEEQIKGTAHAKRDGSIATIAKGFNTREIADLLHVSNNTIETHRKSLWVNWRKEMR